MSRGRLNKEPELVLEEEIQIEAGKLNVKVTGKCGRSYYLSVEVYFFEPLEKEISVEDMQKIVDANENLVKELKDAKD